ncbi:MAG: hypothetical protein ACRCZI_10040 [Cetobacterium sp.]
MESAFAGALKKADLAKDAGLKALADAGAAAGEGIARAGFHTLHALGMKVPEKEGMEFTRGIQSNIFPGFPEKELAEHSTGIGAAITGLALIPGVAGMSKLVKGAVKGAHPFSKSPESVAQELSQAANEVSPGMKADEVLADSAKAVKKGAVTPDTAGTLLKNPALPPVSKAKAASAITANVKQFQDLATQAIDTKNPAVAQEAVQQYMAVLDAPAIMPQLQQAALNVSHLDTINANGVRAGLKAYQRLKALPDTADLDTRVDAMLQSFTDSKKFLYERVSPSVQQLERHMRGRSPEEGAAILQKVVSGTLDAPAAKYADDVPNRPDKSLLINNPAYEDAGTLNVPLASVKLDHPVNKADAKYGEYQRMWKEGRETDNIVVLETSPGKFTSISGNRRVSEAIDAGMSTLPANVVRLAVPKLRAEEAEALQSMIAGGASPAQAVKQMQANAIVNALDSLKSPRDLIVNPDMALPVIAAHHPVKLASLLAEGDEILAKDLTAVLNATKDHIEAGDVAAITTSLKAVFAGLARAQAPASREPFEQSMERLRSLIQPQDIGRTITPEDLVDALTVIPDATPQQMAHVMAKTMEHSTDAPLVKQVDNVPTSGGGVEPPAPPAGPRTVNGPQGDLPLPGVNRRLPTFPDAFQWYTINQLLTPGSAAINLIAPPALYALEIVSRSVSGRANQLKRMVGGHVPARSVQPGEDVQMLIAAKDGIMEALHAGFQAVKTGKRSIASLGQEVPIEHALNRQTIPALFDKYPHLKGRIAPASAHDEANWMNGVVSFVGQVTGLPSRLLLGGDQFNAVFAKRATIRTEAYRQLKDEQQVNGMSDKAFTKAFKERVAEWNDNPPAWLDKKSTEFAEYVTLNHKIEPGMLSKANDMLAELHPVARVLVQPFFRTLANNAHRSMEYTPGLAQRMDRYTRALNHQDPAEAQLARSRTIAGTALLASGMELAYLGLVDGPGSDNQRITRQLEAAGFKEFSLHLPGGEFIHLDQLGMVGQFLKMSTLLSALPNTYGTDDAAVDEAIMIAAATVHSAMNFSFMKDSVSALQLLTSDPTHFGSAGKAGDSAGKLIANLIPQSARKAEELMTEKVLKEANGFLERLVRRLPYFRGTLITDRDLYGEPFAADVHERYGSRQDDTFLHALNELELGVASPSRLYQGRPLTDAEYEQRQITVGKHVKELAESGDVQEVMKDPDIQLEYKREQVGALLRKAQAKGNDAWLYDVEMAPLIRAKEYKQGLREPVQQTPAPGILR